MKNVMIWTGAGQIGMAIARRMGYGMKIIVGDKKIENAQAISEIMNHAGYDVEPVEMDLSSRDSILNLIAKAQAYGEIKMLVNAAGVSPSQAPIEKILNVDLYGTAVLLEEVGKVIAPGGVGVIEKGNTEIIAEMIAEETGGELFHIERDTPYPAEYEACTDEAKQEQSDNARPKLKSDMDISDYDIIYLGYPTWWGDMPMPVYTFLEAHDWNGKTVIPFCTHAGSGLSNTETSIKDTCSGATVLDGLAVAGTTAQNNRDEAESSVTEWLEQIGQ